MTEPGSARVDVLTAQVRVLMVGNQQITTSVAKQLDRAPLVEVFGRIDANGWSAWFGLLIGRDAGGALALEAPNTWLERMHPDLHAAWFDRDRYATAKVLVASDALREFITAKFPLIILAGLR
jgi:hypothetical protein